MEFLTLVTCCKQNPDHAKLIRAVVKQFGGIDNETQSMMKNILSHGIDGGYHGFIWHSETCKFAQKNQKQITALLENQAEQFDIDVVEMVNGFKPFRKNGMDKDDKKDLYLFLAGQAGRCKGTTIPNLFAWYAAEEVCRMFLPEY